MLNNLKNFSLPEIEEKVLDFWKKNKIFEKSLAKNKGKKKFIFYEGPPSANARPGIHHVLARAFKDLIPRYKTMRGFLVPRKAGWDTHGLPIEVQVEKELTFKSKQDIEHYGVANFNKKCRELVWLYKDEWEKLTERIGFWLDLKNPYITYENSYIETLWWIIKQIWDKKLLYKGHKVVPWCTRCGTSLSSHELAQGYENVEENSVYVKFKIKNQKAKIKINENTYILSWTTTPWTLPGNVALAVGEKIKYVLVEKTDSKERYILAKDLAAKSLDTKYQILNTMSGKDLLGLEYEPLFNISALKAKAAYKVYPADFVTTKDGTGVVHTAVMYGVDDYELGRKIGLPEHHLVDEQGKFKAEVSGLSGLYVKDKATEEKIINYLKTKDYLLKTQPHKHDYPFCWRCGTPLLYYARDSWFVSMSKLRTKLQANNNKINWVPANVKRGRFGEWLNETKDWNFSRERYWGTPLPLWHCEKCNRYEAIGSRSELSERVGHSRNKYFLVRHGLALNNVELVANSDPKNKDKYPLTLDGVVHAEKLAKSLKNKKIDLIFSSDFRRAKETAEIIAKTIGFTKIDFDQRLREINTGIFDGRPIREYENYANSVNRFLKAPEGGETLRDVAKRVFEFINDCEKRYDDKTILIVSHENPIWLLEAVARGWSEEEALKARESGVGDYIKPVELQICEFLHLPRNENGFGDLHKPYVDAVHFLCKKCGSEMRRVKEVVDVWFDSGAMPFAQAHWPFVQTEKSETKNRKLDYPADYISEAVDQTRGWFYTLLAIATLLGKGAPYKNVICLGHVLDKNGQKMSKSKGNVIDPWAMIQKYGADAVRWYFYTVNPPGEPKLFNEDDLRKTSNQFFNLLYNSFVFYNTYADKKLKNKNHKLETGNILDKWILARLNELIVGVTHGLEKYDINSAARAIEEFGGDLSRWYIRRSRRRFQKPDSQKDYKAASVILGYTLLELSKLIAPFAPFFAEAIYKSFHTDNKASVHLAEWPFRRGSERTDKKLIREMAEVRKIAAAALAKRAEAGIKVRQPLNELKIKNSKLKITGQLLKILKDEINVKKITHDSKIKDDVWLDTNITHELKEEGWLRDLVRTIQQLRQDGGFEPKDKVVLMFETPAKELVYLAEKNEATIKKEVGAQAVEYRKSPKFHIELETKLDEWPLWLGLRKPQ